MSPPCALSWSRTAGPLSSSSWAARPDPDRDDNNVNARYVVEEADITGVPDDELTRSLRDDLQSLVGQRLDSGEADRVQRRMERELTRYEISRSIRRGSQVGRIRLVPDRPARRSCQRGCASKPPRSKALFHSEQGWGSYLDLGIGDRNIRFTPFAAIDNADDLVEEYSGYGLRFEARRLGTRRLGASLVVHVRSGLAERNTGSARGRAADCPSLRQAVDVYALAEVCLRPGPQRRCRREHLGAGAALPGHRLADGERGRRVDRLQPPME